MALIDFHLNKDFSLDFSPTSFQALSGWLEKTFCLRPDTFVFASDAYICYAEEYCMRTNAVPMTQTEFTKRIMLLFPFISCISSYGNKKYKGLAFAERCNSILPKKKIYKRPKNMSLRDMKRNLYYESVFEGLKELVEDDSLQKCGRTLSHEDIDKGVDFWIEKELEKETQRRREEELKMEEIASKMLEEEREKEREEKRVMENLQREVVTMLLSFYRENRFDHCISKKWRCCSSYGWSQNLWESWEIKKSQEREDNGEADGESF